MAKNTSANDKEDVIEFKGVVTEALSNGMFRVKLENNVVVLGHLAGRMRRFKIKVLLGDTVKLEMSPYDLTRGRITFREKGNSQPIFKPQIAPK